jgi:glycosyltransferase involved in cell wall biosynthesis
MMLNEKKIVVVLPAYNAEKTLEATYADIPHAIVDAVLLVDDRSSDRTLALSRRLGIHTFEHHQNLGYGGNQKTCYREAMKLGADIVVMLHPDYQYTPKLMTAMASLIAEEQFDVVLELSEYHTGYRAFSRGVLEALPLLENSDDFVFDNQMLAQIIYFGFSIGEITCPTKYFEEGSSISFSRSVIYGMGVLETALRFRLQKLGWHRSRIFDAKGGRLPGEA